MKGIGNILLMVFFALAVIGLIWVVLTPGSMSSEINAAAWINHGITSYMVLVPVILLGITLAIFIFYKVLDLIKHPSHMREAIYVVGAIIVALLIGLVAGNSDAVYSGREVVEAGFVSRMISAGLIAAGILLLVGMAFLIWDTVRGFIKS